MQLINLILVSIFTSLAAPVVTLALSAYTLYSSIALARISKNRHEDLMSAAAVGRHLTKTKSKSAKSLHGQGKKSSRGIVSGKSSMKLSKGSGIPSKFIKGAKGLKG
jgi:hypothetical protein